MQFCLNVRLLQHSTLTEYSYFKSVSVMKERPRRIHSVTQPQNIWSWVEYHK